METTTLIIGIIISAIVSAVYSESILQGMGLLLAKINLPNQADIEGVWKVEFTLKEDESVSIFKETIKIVKRLGIIYGYNIPDPENHEVLKKVEENKPLRLRGNLVDNRYLTGVWFHPNKKSRFHGSYQLLVDLSGNKMSGRWTGYSETKNSIDFGSWNFLKEND
jgi:hypothetical protein